MEYKIISRTTGSFYARKLGFTLIELLVVISIIGLLSSVVLASLNSARRSAADSAVKAQLSNMRAAAALIYENTGSYDTVCNATTDTGTMYRAAYQNGTKTANQSMCVSSGGASACTVDLTTVNCGTTPQATGKWATVVELKGKSTRTWFCVDYKGTAAEFTSRTIDTANGSGGADADC